MLQVGIVEDNPRDMEDARAYLAEYFSRRDRRKEWDYHLACYTSGLSFLREFRRGKMELLLLDIYMPYMTGIEVAKKVRALDPAVKIIFLTTSLDHALDSYAVFASGYVLKPLSEHKGQLTETLDRALPDEAARLLSIPVRLPGQQTLALPYRQILYVDTSEGRGAVFHLCGKTISTLCPYKEVAEILASDARFLECYHRVLINMDYVVSMGEDTFKMKDGLTLPISRRKKKEVQQAYMQYLLEK